MVQRRSRLGAQYQYPYTPASHASQGLVSTILPSTRAQKAGLQRWPTPLPGPVQSSFTLVAWMVVRTAAALTAVAGCGITTLGPATIIQTSITSALRRGGTLTMDAVLASAVTAATAAGSVNGLAGFPSSDDVNALRFSANSRYEVATTPAATPGKTIYGSVRNNFDNHANRR